MAYSPNQVLANSVEREFERAVLPFLRILWPDLAQAPAPRGHWDRLGIDLLTSTDERPIECCVECKGFHVEELGNKQFYQIKQSIHKFEAAKIPVKTYIVAHNRDSRNRKILEKINSLLRRLVDRNLAETAEIWDRQTIIKQVTSKVRRDLSDRIRQRSTQALNRLEQLYGPRWSWQYHVPITHYRYSLKRHLPPKLVVKSGPDSSDLTEALLSHDNSRWTMLAGIHGTGKTTAALLAAHQDNRTILYAECKHFRYENLGGGINALTKEIAIAAGITSTDDEHDKEYNYLAGRELSRLIRQPDSSLALLIDGLDENRYYHRARGLSIITSQLAEARCPIILTMRKEQFDESFNELGSSLQQAFHDFSLKNAPDRQASVLVLDLWSEREVLEFLRNLTQKFNDKDRAQLQVLCDAVVSGKAKESYGTLIYHPLYLSFIISDVLDNSIRSVSRIELIENWLTKKIFRDRDFDRIIPDRQMDRGRFVTLMFELLESVAFSMTSGREDSIELIETLDESTLEVLALEHFPKSDDLTLGLLLNSVLVPTSPRQISKSFRVSFAHRLFQEYFLARALIRKEINPRPYPPEIRQFHDELLKPKGTIGDYPR